MRIAVASAQVGEATVDPGQLVVAPGTHLVLDVVNEDSVAHDLMVKDGPHTPITLTPGVRYPGTN